MANTYVRGRAGVDNIQSGSGYSDVTSQIQKLSGIKTKLPAMIPYTEAMPAEEGQKLRWKKEGYFPWKATINGAAASGDTTLTFDEVDIFQVGQVLKSGNEDIRVDSIDSSSNTATVTRGINGTSAASIADNAELLISAPIYTEASQAGLSPTKYGEFVENYYCHLGWSTSETDWSTGTPSVFVDQATRMAKTKADLMSDVIPRQFEILTMYGNSVAMDADTPGSMKGIANFITTNATASTGALSMTAIMDAVETIRQNQGNSEGETVRTLVGNMNMRRIFTALARAYAQYSYDGVYSISPTIAVQRFSTEVGQVDFLMVDTIQSGELYVLDMSDFEYVPLKITEGLGPGWVEFEQGAPELGYPGRAWHYWFNGTLKVGHEELHHKFTGVTTTLSTYPGSV